MGRRKGREKRRRSVDTTADCEGERALSFTSCHALIHDSRDDVSDENDDDDDDDGGITFSLLLLLLHACRHASCT